MRNYILQRLTRSILTTLGVSFLVFGMIAFLPGDPLLYMFKGESISKEALAIARHNLGLDLPFHIRYLRWLGRMLQGDLGMSIHITNYRVSELLLAVAPQTVQLTAFSIVLAVMIGVPAGVAAAIKQNSWLDTLSMVVTTIGVSMPLFWTGLLAIWFFAVQLRWFPVAGGYSWKTLILPGLTLGFQSSCLIARVTRSSMLEVLRQDYVRTARAKGLAEPVVLMRHAMKNALIPVLTVLGLQVGWLLGGSVIVETVFSRPGIGKLLAGGIQYLDFPLVQGVILVIAVAFVSINFLVDICYAYFDPRIRYE